jgi:hypothetical protein
METIATIGTLGTLVLFLHVRLERRIDRMEERLDRLGERLDRHLEWHIQVAGGGPAT